MRFADWNRQKRHPQPVISRPGLREREGFLEIQVMGSAILHRDMGAIGDLDRIAMRIDLRLADQLDALADVPPIADLQESPCRIVLLAIGIRVEPS
jgi:hypothetical protein